MAGFDYDVLIVGSGFGGSVAALRLTEKGYRVGVIEAGRRFGPDSFPTTNWDLRRFLWFPRLGMRGIQRLSLLKDVFILSGVGVGGGSLVYAATLYEPLDAFWSDPQWADITDWREELNAHYARAKYMLGVDDVPFETPADGVMRRVAERLGVADTFHHTKVGIYFGEPGVETSDPYFGGAGPARAGCERCGGCVVGCRHNAKNSLDRNYLYLAEASGAVVHPEREAVDVVPLGGGGYEIVTRHPGAWLRKRLRTFSAEQVIFSGGVLGTLELLFALRERGRLPNLSRRLGDVVRTNSEAISGAVARDASVDYSTGLAITSSIHPDAQTHIESVRYPKGSNAMALLATIAVDGGGRIPRPIRFLAAVLRDPAAFGHSLSIRRWSERTIIIAVMQSFDNSIRIRGKLRRGRVRLRSERGHGAPNPTHMPVGIEAARIAAEEIGGDAVSPLNEVLFNIPTTAHILGGCCIGATASSGVVDPYQRIYGHPGLHVVDGSTITANLGVNPSLTITAQSERAMSLWPNKGELDPRPALGADYIRVDPVPAHNPAVTTGRRL